MKAVIYRMGRVLMVLSAGAGVALVLAQPVATERADFTAEYLNNFARFTDWPAGTDQGGRLRVCALVGAALHGQLQRASEATLSSKRIEIVEIDAITTVARDCQVVFLGEGREAELNLLPERLGSAPVLTISDSTAPATGDVVMIHVHGDRARPRFDINLRLTREAGLRLHAQLLDLAAKVTK